MPVLGLVYQDPQHCVDQSELFAKMFASPRAVKAVFRHQAQSRNFTSSIRRNADFTHAVVGGGAIGLAIARRLQQVEGAQVVLIEKHGMVGSETSSRNSEV